MSRASSTPPHAPSLATRLTLWYVVSAFALVGIATATLYWALVTNLLREDDEFLAGKIEVIRGILANSDGQRDGRELRWEVTNAERSPRKDMQVLLRFIDERGEVVMETAGMADILPASSFPAPFRVDQVADGAMDAFTTNGERHRVVSAKAIAKALPNLPSAPGEWTVQVALIEDDEDAFLHKFRSFLWTMLGVLLVLCAGIGYAIARRGLRPLERVAETVRQIRPTDLARRVDARGLPPEVGELAMSFNGMMDRLEESFARLSRFSADIAHELRTPIHNLQGTTEVALGSARTPGEYRDALSSNLEECSRISRLIDNLLFIARAENPRTAIQRVELDVDAELVTIRDFYAALAEEAGITLLLQTHEAGRAMLDRSLFQRAVGNLIENSLAHTPQGGTITLRARGGRGQLVVEVEDNGSGIPPEHLPHVFDRFHRADPARSRHSGGVGLGLALTRSITSLHGGTASVTSTMGAGTIVTLVFPAVSSGGGLPGSVSAQPSEKGPAV